MTRTVAITGASGLVGHAFAGYLEARGDVVRTMVRREPRTAREIGWKPGERLPPERLEGIDAIVHLAGESVAGGRWTAARKRAIRESRVAGTTTISEAIAAMDSPPAVLVSASAVGFYGDRGEEELDEQSAPGDDYLADVCRAWEAAADPARDAGARVVHPRTGMVLATHGGALAKMLPVFRAGAGGRLGDGRQWMSWITLDDLIRLLALAIENPALDGPVNAASPHPVRNEEFARTLADALHRPALIPAPEFALRAALGEMADALLLCSQRVRPSAALDAGFVFEHDTLPTALQSVLG